MVFPLTPLYHAAAWGLPYTSALTGSGLVFVGPHIRPHDVADVLEREEESDVRCGVPFFWLSLDEANPPREAFASLERIVCGGSAIPTGLVQRYLDRGVTMQQGLGMTENVALVALSNVRSGKALLSPERQIEAHYTQGLAVPGVELRLVGEHGLVLPKNGIAQGELEVRSLRARLVAGRSGYGKRRVCAPRWLATKR